MTSRRFKSVTMKFGVPLSVPGSRQVERCYGMHGKGFAGSPEPGTAIDLLLINPLRQVWLAPGYFPERHSYRTDAVERDSGWRILGWRMADGSMPLGDHDDVDPELAQWDYLPLANPGRDADARLSGDFSSLREGHAACVNGNDGADR